MTLPAGTRLDRYEIISQLGAGGMGEVYLAEDTRLHRQVALKILPLEVAAHHDRMHRFTREATAAASLNHPNIAHIYEIGEAEPMPPTGLGEGQRRVDREAGSGKQPGRVGGDVLHFIAMEFVDGLTLREKIHRQHTELTKLLRYLQQVAEGLAKAHGAGVVHRDLKPDNIMITGDGHAKILDFGLVKLIEPSLPAHTSDPASSEVATAVMPQHSTPGTVLGTVGYMSPEQAQGKTNEIDHRSDIFSFGCILFEAATGRKAFEGKDALDSLHKIVHTPSPQISELNPAAPVELQRIVRRCLAKDPEKRYQSIKDVAIELEELNHELKGETALEYSVPPARSEPSAISSGGRSEVDSLGRSTLGTATAQATRSSSNAALLTTEVGRHRKRVAIVLAGCLIAAIGIAFGLYKLLLRKQQFNLHPGKLTRLTSSGKVGSASISPDGKYVAYSSLDEQGQGSLWVKYLATGSNVQIVPPLGPEFGFGQSTFSPDGNYIYYLVAERGRLRGALYQVPVLGGTSKKLLDNASRITFSPDGKRFAFHRRYISDGEDALIVVNADTNAEQKLAIRKHPDFFLPGAAWSPDGQTIACPAGGFTGGYYRSIAVINLSDGTQKLLASHKWNDVQRVAWLPDGSGLVTTAQEQGGYQFQLWQVSYPEGEAQPLTNDLSDYQLVSLTADARAMVTVLSESTSNIWLVPNGDWNNGRQLTSTKTNGIHSIDATADGRIIYQSRTGGNPDLWIMDADGRNQKQLTDDTRGERFASATPDGRYIVFGATGVGTQLWRMDIDGSNPKLLTTTPGFDPTISPDGKWVVFTTFGPRGFSIWKVSIDGGEPVQITNTYAQSPAISPDGQSIACYYLEERTKNTRIAVIPFAGGEPTQLFDLLQPFSAPPFPVRWAPDGRALTYIINRGGVSNLWIQPLDNNPARQLTDFKSDRIYSFDWSPDGKWLALSRGPEQRDAVLMSEFK